MPESYGNRPASDRRPDRPGTHRPDEDHPHPQRAHPYDRHDQCPGAPAGSRPCLTASSSPRQCRCRPVSGTGCGGGGATAWEVGGGGGSGAGRAAATDRARPATGGPGQAEVVVMASGRRGKNSEVPARRKAALDRAVSGQSAFTSFLSCLLRLASRHEVTLVSCNTASSRSWSCMLSSASRVQERHACGVRGSLACAEEARFSAPPRHTEPVGRVGRPGAVRPVSPCPSGGCSVPSPAAQATSAGSSGRCRTS